MEMKKIQYIYTILFGVAVVLFFGLAYPHHLHYQEQFQLFLFDSNYVWDVVKQPGGVADSSMMTIVKTLTYTIR